MQIEATTTLGELDVFSQRESVALELTGPNHRGHWHGIARCGDNVWRATRLTLTQVLQDLIDQMRGTTRDW